MIKIIQKNKILCIIFIITILLIFSNSTFAYSNLTSYKPKYGVLTANVNFRTTASTSSGRIKTLAKGTSVKMVGDLDKFYIVQLSTNEIGVVSKYYTRISPTSLVTNSNVNLRRGPSTGFAKIETLKKGTSIKAVGYIDNWYIVVTSNNKVGCIRKDLVTSSKTNTSNSTSNNSSNSSFNMSENEKIIFDLINKARNKAGIAKLSSDASLFKVARLKSEDMVKKSYFSHTSPTYGSPFNMMQNYGISYKVAGENIAGNPSLENAVKAWLNSATHKQNILSNSYNYVGIGVYKSDTYGYIITAMFIRKIARDSLAIFLSIHYIYYYLHDI